MFHYRNDPGADGVGVAFSDAIGSGGEPLSLGGQHGAGGRPAGITILERALQVRLAVVRQVHGDRVLAINHDNVDTAAEIEADAMVTTAQSIALTIRVADCVPVLLADSAAGVIGAAHAGRRGLATGVLSRTVEAMRSIGAVSIRGWIGPHICGSCYEVPEAMAEEIGALVPGARSTTSWGTPALDLGAGVDRQLRDLGVGSLRVDGCTRTTGSLHSYRRDGTRAGRQAGCIWLPARVSR
ncbi:MAG: polyphenol oxidase family protein [Micropruina sp.]|nr:polyphenol oxidase family protein [Micropruina sp.]